MEPKIHGRISAYGEKSGLGERARGPHPRQGDLKYCTTYGIHGVVQYQDQEEIVSKRFYVFLTIGENKAMEPASAMSSIMPSFWKRSSTVPSALLMFLTSAGSANTSAPSAADKVASRVPRIAEGFLYPSHHCNSAL